MAHDGGYTMLSSSLSERPSRPRGSWSSSSSTSRVSAPPKDDDDTDEDEDSSRGTSSSLRRVVGFPADPTAEEEVKTTTPRLAFSSQHGYKVFSLADMRVVDADEVQLRPVLGRRLVPSPYGGTVLAADVCYRYPCHLADPFTGEVTPLPDLPVPRSETEPVPCARNEPRPRCARLTGDGLAWDWSSRGVVVARGDTAFFCAHGGGGEWAPVHRSWRGSHMTVNQRGGRFFVMESSTLRTTVIDAATRRACAEIAPPPGVEDVDGAYLAPCGAADALLLVHRAGDRRGVIFTEVYRARYRGGGPAPARWKRVEDIGDRAVFVDGAHGFTVRAGSRVRRNHVYVTLSWQVAGRAAAVFDVGLVDLRRPERMERMGLDTGEVERAWGCQPYWIIPKDGRDRREHD